MDDITDDDLKGIDQEALNRVCEKQAVSGDGVIICDAFI